MNKNINKIIAFALSIFMLLCNTPALASSVGSIANDTAVGEDTAQNASTSYDNVGEGSSDTAVYLTIDDNNVIAGVPTTIIVNGTANEYGENIGKYSVEASGDIAGDKELTILPESTEIALTQKGKDNVTASISQEKTAFSSDDLANGASSTGYVTANLTAGEWKGEANFIISLNTQLLPGYTTLYEYDLSATENDDVKAYYMVPNENTSPIEIETTEQTTASLNLLSSITDLFTPMTVYAAEDNVIEYNGVRYELSDEDTLVISGTGEMKSNIQSELVDYEALYKDVEIKFNVRVRRGDEHISSTNTKPTISFLDNSVLPCHRLFDTVSTETYNEIETYCENNWKNYGILFPKEVIVNSGVSNISNSAFEGCLTLEKVTVSNGVESIDYNAFKRCTNLKEITLPNSITSIGYSSFAYCENLTDITGLENVTTLGQQAFGYCSSLKRISIPCISQMGNDVFYNCTSLTDVTLGNDIEAISGEAFYNCTGLTDIIIPDSVKIIGIKAFYGCDGLTSIIIPDSVTNINSCAFYSCNNLTTVTIGSSVANISTDAFSCCNLSNIVVNENNQNYISQDNVLFNKDKTTLILYPVGKTNTSYKIPDSITNLGNYAFYGCTGLTNVTIPNSVTSIGDCAFYNCTGLTDITIPDSITNLGNYAFYNCTGLTNVTIPNSVTNIGQMAFIRLASNSTIYCQTQDVAELLSGKYTTAKTTVVVAPEMFA